MPPAYCDLDYSNPYSSSAKKRPPCWVVFFWQRMRDSNPRERSQSPVCYRYTNPLYAALMRQARILLYAITAKSQEVFSFFSNFFCPDNAILSGQRLFYSSQGKGFPFKTDFFKYRKVRSSPLSRSIVKIYSSCCRFSGCISVRSRLFIKYSNSEPG